MTKRKKSRMDRVHISLYDAATEISNKEDIPRVQAYRELAKIAREKKRKKRNEVKDFFKI